MEFLLIIVLVVIVIVLARKSSKPGGYEQGYWDGYRALGEKVSTQLEQDSIDRSALRKAVNLGIYGEEIDVVSDQSAHRVSAEETTRATPMSKHDASLRNSNILLYMASFLLIAAGAAFIGTAMPDMVKLVGIGVIVALFYGVGLTLYQKVETLRPAAIAFAGTGLALLPFFGIALYQYGGVDANLAWFLTSLLGLGLYLYAAIQLHSQIISYLTMAFVISLATSFVATIALPIVWYFVVIIGISLVSSLVAYIRPKWVPYVFSEPIERTGQIATPVALAASLAVYDQLSLQGYEIVFGIATAQYLVTWLQSRRRFAQNAARGLAHATALLVAWDIAQQNTVVFGLLFLLLATVQLLVSCLLIYWKRRTHYHNEVVWLVVAMTLQFVSLCFWTGDSDVAMLNAITLSAIGLGSLAAYQACRNVAFAIPALFVSVVLPFIVGRAVMMPALQWEWLAWLFVGASAGVLYVYPRVARTRSAGGRYFMIAAFAAYVFTATLTTFGSQSDAFAAVSFLALALFCAIASWVYRLPLVLIASTLLGTFAAAKLWHIIGGDSAWLLVGVAWITAAVYYLASWVMLERRDATRHKVLFGSALAVLFIAVLYAVGVGDIVFARAAAWMVVVIGVLLALEGDRRKNAGLIEISAYIATFGLQSVVHIDHTATSPVVYAHWWALTIFLAGFFRGQLMPRAMVAVGFITVPTGLYALSEGGGYQLFFLIEHLMLLLIGATRGISWAIWWGIVASSLAVLYFLRDIAFLAFAFLGLLLAGIVIWRLIRNQHKSSAVDK